MTDENSLEPPEADAPAAGRRWIRVVARLLMSLTALALPLLVLEVSLRRAPGGRAAVDDRSHAVCYPEPSRLHPWTRGETNVLRIAVVGDSVTVGVGVQPNDNYGARLERLLNLNDGGRPAEVRVYARAGTGAATQLDLLSQALDENPDLLIMGICLNDAEHSGSAELKAWRRKLVVGTPPAWLASIEKHCRTATWLRLKLAHLRINREYYRYYVYLYDPNQAGWRLFVRGVESFHRQCAERKVRLMAVIPPLMTDIDRVPYPFAKYHDMIGREMKQRDIPCLDLRPEFLGKLPIRMEALPGVDAHPSEIAHRVIAERLFAFLIENGLVDAAYVPNTTDRGHQREFWKTLSGSTHHPEPAPAPVRSGPATNAPGR